MTATPYLNELAEWFAKLRLDTVMIGNAAAAINGAPVTTLDVDFMLKQTDENYRKLAVLAQRMRCQFIEMKLLDNKYMYRLVNQADMLVIDFLFAPAGIESLEALKKNSMDVFFGEHVLRIAALEDILASKRMAGRPKDMAIIPILEMTLNEKRRQ